MLIAPDRRIETDTRRASRDSGNPTQEFNAPRQRFQVYLAPAQQSLSAAGQKGVAGSIPV
jgi:hypothetical protein